MLGGNVDIYLLMLIFSFVFNFSPLYQGCNKVETAQINAIFSQMKYSDGLNMHWFF